MYLNNKLKQKVQKGEDAVGMSRVEKERERKGRSF